MVGTLALAPAAGGWQHLCGAEPLSKTGRLRSALTTHWARRPGGIAFNGGTLRLDQNLNLAATRAIVLNAAGGTIDTQSFNATLAQPAPAPAR